MTTPSKEPFLSREALLDALELLAYRFLRVDAQPSPPTVSAGALVEAFAAGVCSTGALTEEEAARAMTTGAGRLVKPMKIMISQPKE